MFCVFMENTWEKILLAFRNTYLIYAHHRRQDACQPGPDAQEPTMPAYIDRTITSHIPAATLDAMLSLHGAGAPETGRFAGGQRPFANCAARDAAVAAILAAHPRPQPVPMMSLREAALISGPANEAADWA
jgi:hypothetical protein